MKILVTGGAGFIGSHIADLYISLGHNVVIIDNLSSGEKKFINKKAQFYKADIRDRKSVEEILKKERPQIINHHAAQISVKKSVQDPISDVDINITGLLNLLESGRKINVRKIIFASSGGAVYGDAKTIPTPENYSPLMPLSPYGIAKFACEQYIYFYCRSYKISYIILRYSNVYGPRQNPEGEAGVVAIFTKRILDGKKPVINGNGLQTRDFIFVDDVTEANRLALTHKSNQVFNIGCGREMNIQDLYQKIKKLTKSKKKAKYGEVIHGEQKRSCLDNSLGREEMNWEPKIDIETGLIKTIEYFKKYEQK